MDRYCRRGRSAPDFGAASPEDALVTREPQDDVELSVVIPAHNEAALIATQLAALTEQSWHGTYEILVVDNC